MKPHYYYYYKYADNPAHYGVVADLVRTTGTFCCAVEWATEAQIAVGNMACRETGGVFGLYAQPWHRRFGADLPATDWGDSYRAELDYFVERMQWCKERITSPVGALFFDCERFKSNVEDHDAMRRKLDEIHRLGKAIFPDAQIIWYGRGMIQHPVSDKMRMRSEWTGDEITDCLTCSLYGVWEIDRMKAVLEATVELADKKGIRAVNPFVILGGGYVRTKEGHDWTYNHKYDVKHDREIGEYLANHPRVETVVMYPQAFDRRVTAWPEHWAAYLEGANSGTER